MLFFRDTDRITHTHTPYTNTDHNNNNNNKDEASSKEESGDGETKVVIPVATAVPVMKKGPSPEELYAKRMEETKYASLSYKIFEKFKWFNCAHALKLHSAMSGLGIPGVDGEKIVQEKCDESTFRCNKEIKMKRFVRICRMLGQAFDLRYQLFDLEQDEKGVVKAFRGLAGAHIRGVGLGATPSCDPESAHGFLKRPILEEYKKKSADGPYDPWLNTLHELYEDQSTEHTELVKYTICAYLTQSLVIWPFIPKGQVRFDLSRDDPMNPEKTAKLDQIECMFYFDHSLTQNCI